MYRVFCDSACICSVLSEIHVKCLILQDLSGFFFWGGGGYTDHICFYNLFFYKMLIRLYKMLIIVNRQLHVGRGGGSTFIIPYGCEMDRNIARRVHVLTFLHWHPAHHKTDLPCIPWKKHLTLNDTKGSTFSVFCFIFQALACTWYINEVLEWLLNVKYKLLFWPVSVFIQ